MLEVMHELRDIASLHLSSQVYATRWPYGAIVRALSADPDQSADQLAAAVVSCVQQELAANRRDDSVAAIRGGNALKELASAISAYADSVTPLLDSDWDGVVTALVDESLHVDDPHQLDLGSLISKLGKNDPTVQAAAAQVSTKLAATVAHKAAHSTRGPLQGLNIFCPIVRNIDLAAAYQNLSFRTNRWATFLKKWRATLPVYA